MTHTTRLLASFGNSIDFRSLDLNENSYQNLCLWCAYTIIAFVMMVWLVKILARILSLLNGIPGAAIAKITSLWKTYQLREGCYLEKLKELHHLGPVVQVGPYEYSVSDPTRLDRRMKLEKATSLYNVLLRTSDRFGTLTEVLEMSNIFHYEPTIDECNQALLQALADYAETGEDVNIADVVARYAFDTLFATSTGKRAGFLAGSVDISEILNAMESWKFNAIAYGSYLRFHPIIAKILRLFNQRSNYERQIATHLNIEVNDKDGCAMNQMRCTDSRAPSRTLEACIALVVAGCDPAITHILSTLFFIYRDRGLLERLRQEITDANLSQPPKIKDLIRRRPKMPLLHAVLQESLRLHQPHTKSMNFTLPKGGVIIGDKHVPQGCTICVETSIANLSDSIFGADSETFNPNRWLEDPALARSFKNHMVAFGAGTSSCPGREFHTALITKLLCQIIPAFNFDMSPVVSGISLVDMTFEELKACINTHGKVPQFIRVVLSANVKDNPSDSEACTTTWTSPTLSTATTVNVSDTRPLEFKDAEELEQLLGRDITNELFTRFDPNKPLTPRPFLKTEPIHTSHDRYLTHELIERVWGGKLNHQTDRRTQSMFIWVTGSKIPFWLEKLHKRLQQQPRKQDTKKVQPKPAAPANGKVAWTERPERQGVKDMNAYWLNFATTEHVRVTDIYAKSGEEYTQDKAKTDDSKPPADTELKMTSKEVFKQTCKKTEQGIDVDAVRVPAVPPHLRDTAA